MELGSNIGAYDVLHAYAGGLLFSLLESSISSTDAKKTDKRIHLPQEAGPLLFSAVSLWLCPFAVPCGAG